MPISPTGSSSAKSSSFRGPLDLAGGPSVDYGRSPDRSNDGLPSASSSNAAKHSPIIPDDHPMPWELYEHQGVTPPPLPSPTRTVFTFTTSPATVATAPSDFSSSNAGMTRMPSNGSRGGAAAAAAAEQDHLHLTTTEQSGSNLAGPVSPHSAGSSGGGSIQPGNSAIAATSTTDSTVTTPPSALRSPGGATSGFFAALRPASPRITTTGSRDDASTSVLRRDKERTSSTSTTGNNTADAVPNASSSASHQRVARDPKTLDARSRRPSSVFEHVGNVFERWGKKVHHRSESKEGRSATPVILSSSAGMSGSALAVASEEEQAPASSSSQAVEYLDSPSLRPTPPPLLRNWSGSSALSMYDDFEVVSRPQQAAATTATSAGVPAVLGRTLIQVTEDNERFAVVDVSGLSTAAGIKERMLSKLHRFDDDSSTFSIHRTEIGLSDSTSDGPALGDEALFTLCAHSGDDKGNLKFLVSQLGPPSEPNHDAMPPPMPMMSPRNRRAGGSELPAVYQHQQHQSGAAESSGGSPRSPVVPAGASALAYMHGKSNSISSLSSTGDFAQQQQGGYDSGSDASRQPHRIGSGSLTRSKMIRRGAGGGGGGAGGAASGDESQQQQQQLQNRRSSITGSPRISTRLPSASSTSSTAAAHHREQRSGSLGADRAPSSHVLGDAHARMRQTSDSATHAHSHSHSHQDIAEEVEELRISLSDEGGGSTAAAGGSTSGEPSSSSTSRLAARDGSTARPTPQQHARRNVSGSRRPATSQGALGGDPSTSVAGPPPASAPFTTTSYDINDAARMYSHHETASPSTPGVNSSGGVSHAEHGHGQAPHPHQLYAAGSFEEHLLRARRGSDVGPQTQASAQQQQQQQQQQHARNDPFVQGAAILPEELIAAARSRGSDDRYPSMTVARASASSASSADSGASGTSGQQQQGKQGSGSGGSARQPIDYESLNARHGLRPGAAGAHIYGSSAPSSGAAAAVFASPPQMMMGPGSPAPWAGSTGGGDLRSPPFAATRPPQMRPAMSSDGYGQGYGAPPHHPHHQQQQQHPGAALRSPTGYATSEFGMRTAIGSPPLQATLSGGGGSSNGPPAPSFPFPQRPHTFHDAGYYHHHPHQQHLAASGMQHRASPRPGPAPIRPAAPPENPYTQALFPQSSSRQVSEFQRSGQSVGTVLSPGMTVQESMRQQQSQHGQQGQGQGGSYHHYGFGPREPRVQHHHQAPHGQGHPQAWQQQQQQQQQHGGGGHHPSTWDHGYGAQHPQQQQQFRPYPAPPAGLDPRYGPAPGQGRMPLSPRPPPQAPAPVLPTSIPLGVHQNAQASSASFAQPPSQQPTFHQQAQPQPQARTSIPSSSDRSSTSSYVSSSAGSFHHHPHAQQHSHQQHQHQQHQQQQHGRDYSADGAPRGAYYGGYNNNDDANTAPTSARSSRSGPPLSPESATAAGGAKGQQQHGQQQRDRAGSGAGSANAQSPFKRAPTPGSMAMARGYSDGGSSSRGMGGGGHDGSAAQHQHRQAADEEEEEELDLSKIRPLPQPPTSAGGTTPLSPSHAQMHPRSPSQHREDEGTLKAAQWAAMLGRSASDGGAGATGGGGSDTLRQAKPPNSATTQSPSSALTTASTQESSASGSTSTPTPSRIGVAGDGTEQQRDQQVPDPEPGTGTFASFASFADDDDDAEGGTWAKPLDAMPAAPPAATPTPAPAAAAAASSSSSSASAQDMAPSVTLRPPSTSIVGRPAASSMPGSPSLSSQPPRVNSPRRPELRLTIDSPRAQSPLPPGHAPIPSPRGPRASPGAAGAAGGVSPRLGNDGTLMPSNTGGGSATLTPSGIQRSSSFARRGDNEWALRPPPEQLYENLDDFFPRHDLDKPVLELGPGAPPPPPSASGYAAAGLPSAATPMTTAAHYQQQAPSSPSSSQQVAHSPTSANALARHKKSIRRVAQDRVRGAGLTMTAAGGGAAGPTPSSSSAIAAGGNNNNAFGGTPSRASVELARRPSTKLWGTKLLEVTPGHEQSASGSSSASSSSSSSSSSSGRPVFKWVKGDLIGKGTYGRVYIALNATTGEMIAVKQVELPTTEHDRHDARQRDVVAALKSEISTLKDLDHPHIVSYLGFEETPEHLHLFLEYVPGGSIASVLRKYGKLEEGIIKYFVHQVLSGLSYLHERGVLHRDLKGDNLLVNLDGTVKISDFGTMRKSDDIYADVAGMSLQGSVFWMAPEVVLLTKKGYSAKVDIWSLGCVTLEMFAGRRPWSDDEAVQAMFKIGKEGRAPPVPPDVRLSREAAHFLRNCFFIDPNERPTAARLLDHVFPDVPAGWEFRETRLWRMMQRSLQIRAQAQAGAGQK